MPIQEEIDRISGEKTEYWIYEDLVGGLIPCNPAEKTIPRGRSSKPFSGDCCFRERVLAVERLMQG